MDVVDQILKAGTELGPVTILLQMLIWGGLGCFGCWRFVRRRVVSKDAAIAKLASDVEYWEGRFGEKEREAEASAALASP